MSSSNGRPKLSEKGLLTPDNCVVALIDHQPQMLFGVSNFDRQTIINNTVALAKAARVFDVPVVLTTVETKSFSGNLWPQIKAVFPKQEPIERSSMNSWDSDCGSAQGLDADRHPKLLIHLAWEGSLFGAYSQHHHGRVAAAHDVPGAVRDQKRRAARRRTGPFPWCGSLLKTRLAPFENRSGLV